MLLGRLAMIRGSVETRLWGQTPSSASERESGYSWLLTESERNSESVATSATGAGGFGITLWLGLWWREQGGC